jgi:uncharacterized membrane-anchored protein
MRQGGGRLCDGGDGEVAGVARDHVALHQRLGTDVIALLLGRVVPVAEHAVLRSKRYDPATVTCASATARSTWSMQTWR